MSWTFALVVALAIAFNMYMADVIIRLRQDVQVIRKRLGVAKVTLPDDASSAATTKPQETKNKESETEETVLTQG